MYLLENELAFRTNETQILVFGDTMNDQHMFELGFQGIAVKNSEDDFIKWA